jgi:hypothetical protein
MAASVSTASARAINFGPETVVRHLQDVQLQTGSGEPLYLGYRVVYHWFGLPYAVSGGGYVLGVRGKNVHYEVDSARISEWQAQGHVPSPLPQYKFSIADYVLGYLAWIVAGLMSAWYGARFLLGRRATATTARKAAAAAASPAMLKRAAQAVAKAPPSPATTTAPPPPSAAPVPAPAAAPAPTSPAAAAPSAPTAQPASQPTSMPPATRAAATPVATAQIQQPREGQAPASVRAQMQSISSPPVRPAAQPQPPRPLPAAPDAPRVLVARTVCRVKALKVA